MKSNFFKHISLSILLSLIYSVVGAQFSQQKTDPHFVPESMDRKGLIGVSFGPSFPMGDFGSTAVNNEKAGLANTGTVLDFNFTYKLGKNTGVTALYRIQNNPIDEDVFISAYSFLGLTTQLDADNWKVGAFLGGLYVTIPTSITRKTYFDGRVMIGFASATSPRIKLTVTDFTSTVTIEQEAADASSAIIVFGGGFHFNVSDVIAIQTNADFSFLTGDFTDVKIISNISPTTTTNFGQSIETFNLSAGIAIRL